MFLAWMLGIAFWGTPVLLLNVIAIRRTSEPPKPVKGFQIALYIWLLCLGFVVWAFLSGNWYSE